MFWKRIVSSLIGSGSGPLTAQDLERTFQAAVGRLRAGDRLGAEEMIHGAVEQAAAQAGRQSPLYAQALFHESTILASGLGDFARAATSCRAAVDALAGNQNARKDRLTYLMNLGELLTRVGEWDEAERVLRDSLDERRAFYGPTHAGYAYGLGSLADLLLTRGQAEEALERIEEAIAIYQPVRHQELPASLELRACAVKAAKGAQAPAFPDWDNMPPALREAIVPCCLERAERSEPAVALAVLQELRQRLAASRESQVSQLLNVTIALANVARLAGDHAARIEASRAVVQLSSGLDDRRHLLMAYQGLAHALGAAGQSEETEHAYGSALEEAKNLGDRKLTAGVLRNHAIWLAEQGRRQQADAQHCEAVAEAAASGDPLTHGRALVAYGIFVQHGGDTERARTMLEEALGLVPPTEPDAFYAQNHLNAIREGVGCTCGEGDQAFSTLVQRLVQERAPKGLLKNIAIQWRGEDSPEVKVELAREPTQAEMENLNRLIHQALAEMRQTYRQAGYGR